MGEARWIDRRDLAARLSIDRSAIPRLQRRGKLPPPSYHLGPKSPRWDVEAVDAMFAGRVASAAPSIDDLVQDAADAILQGRAA
jgi:predicted DNA-binding transcriptional regulator AlpA